MAERTGRSIQEEFPEEVRELIAADVLDRSSALRPPFQVSFDPGCSFCRKNRQIYRVGEVYEHPEPTFIKRLPVSVAALSYDQTFPGRAVIILRNHGTSFNDFMKSQQLLFIAFMEDVSAVVDALNEVCAPDRMNYSVYMNQNAHLHMHLIPRYKAEGAAFSEPPPFRGINALVPGHDYRSLALKVRKALWHEPSALGRYCERLIDQGLPP